MKDNILVIAEDNVRTIIADNLSKDQISRITAIATEPRPLLADAKVGSAEWRNSQLLQGKCVYRPGDSEYYQADGQNRIIGKIIETGLFNSTWNADTFRRDDSDGWQIYEPALQANGLGDYEPEPQPESDLTVPGKMSLAEIDAEIAKEKERIARWKYADHNMGSPSPQPDLPVSGEMQEEEKYIGYKKDENGKEIDVPDYQEQLEKFVIGKRVKILSYGGNLAKSGDVGVITNVKKEEGWICIDLDRGVSVMVNYTCAEPIPSPQPKVKVGDYAETDKHHHVKLTEFPAEHYKPENKVYRCFNLSLNKKHLIEEREILRILQPSEVKVSITLEGTVERIDEFSFNLEKDGKFAELDYEMLSPADAAIIRELTETKGE